MQTWERIKLRIEHETTPVRRYTKGELAIRLHMSRPALDRRIAGEVGWSVDELEALAVLLGVRVQELVSNTSDETSTTVSDES